MVEGTLTGVLSVGTFEQLYGTAWPDESVWSGYGMGYGFAPVVLPVIALVVLRRRTDGADRGESVGDHPRPRRRPD